MRPFIVESAIEGNAVGGRGLSMRLQRGLNRNARPEAAVPHRHETSTESCFQ